MKHSLQLVFMISMVLFSIKLTAQDIVFLSNGTIIEGKVSIQYSNRSDLVSINGQSILATEVDSVIIANARTLYAIKVKYYHVDRRVEYEKSVLAELVLSGSVQLYKYPGTHFDLIAQKGNDAYVLQKIPNGAVLDKVLDYKSVLLTFFTNKIDRKEVFKLNLNENSLVHIINKYNRVMSGDYASKQVAKIKYNEAKFSYSVGTAFAKLNYTGGVPIGTINQVPVSVDGGVIKNNRSKGSSFVFSFQQNIVDSRNWFLNIGGGLNSYDFYMVTESRYHKDYYFSSKELFYYVGATYRKNLMLNNLSASLGLNVYNQRATERKHHHSYILPGSIMQNKAFGFLIQPQMEYKISRSLSVHIESQHLLRFDNSYHTYNIDEYPTLNATDDLRVFMITAGISFHFIREGIF